MRVQSIKLNSQPKQILKSVNVIPPPKETPLKDAMIVSGYVSLPIVFYEIGTRVYSKVKGFFKINK